MKILRKIRHIQLGWKHILIMFAILITFQILVSRMQHYAMRDLLSYTMDWYKQNSAEQIGNLTTTSVELLLESYPSGASGEIRSEMMKNLVHSLNSILKQPLMKRSVEAVCLILPDKQGFAAVDLGQSLYSYMYMGELSESETSQNYKHAVELYSGVHSKMMKSELITSFKEGEDIFHVFVPLIPYGEYAGAVYLKIHPDISFFSRQILASFNKTVLIFSSLIFMGLLGMFFISTYTLIERDEARELLYKEREAHLREHIEQNKEHLFTKRIYHTHHKAEKVMGFINEDLENADEDNIKEIKYRVSKYANFISRVIYDMKWYNPPLQTIRGPIFKTDLNEVLRFIVNNIFLRTSYQVKNLRFRFNLDQSLPLVSVNEFVIWEIIEPLIQNAIDHSEREVTEITLSTCYNFSENSSLLEIEDNGKGVRPDLLEKNEEGIKRIFLENISTKKEDRNCGYGCYLAYEISKRCGWELDCENLEYDGVVFRLKIRN